MSRLKQTFEALKNSNKKALITFITAGDPHPSVTVNLMHDMVKAGANIVELGVPFSDPMAEGPVIQAACERALAHHVSLRNVLDMVKSFRSKDADTPVILMGYLNPVEVMGYASFAKAAQAAGVDGVLTVDLPPEEAGDFLAELKQVAIDPIFLLSPSTSDARVRKVAAVASGFLYYVSFKGVTGANRLDVGAVANKVGAIRTLTDLPVGVGFGIHDAQSAADVSAVADAVVVGSALVKRIAELATQPDKINAALSAVLKDMRQAMDAQPAKVANR